MAKRTDRSATGLRDILFNEIQELQSGNGDPRRASAVANLARQIVNTVKVELEALRQIDAMGKEGGVAEMGTLLLGTSDAAGGVKDKRTDR